MRHAISLLSLATVLAACGDVGLDLVDPPAPPADVEQEPEPTFCEANPSLPAPVKVLFLVDMGGSMQFSDQPGARFSAMGELVERLANEDALVATMGFGANVYTDPPMGSGLSAFIPAASWIRPEFLEEADVATDLQGALDAAKQYIVLDSLVASVEERQRTRYIVLLVTDGTPGPVCCSASSERVGEPFDPYQCPLEFWETDLTPTSDATYCEMEQELSLCNDASALEQFRADAADVAFGEGAAPPAPDFGSGPIVPLHRLSLSADYNRRAGLEDEVRLLKGVDELGIGSIVLHAVMLSDPTLPDDVKEIFRMNPCRMERLVSGLAEVGGGESLFFSSAGALSFETIDTTPLCAVVAE